MTEDLEALGWDDERANEFAPYESFAVPGRVVRVDRGAADVVTADNPLRVTATEVAVGDWVALAVDDRQWQIAGVLERRTTLTRGSVSNTSQAQVLAANVDVVFVVVAAVPAPRLGMVERLVALAWDCGATPVVVVTKADLHDDPRGVAADLGAIAPGVDVVVTSATSGAGLAELTRLVGIGRTCCLVGKSGVGKSTLANALTGADRLATGGVRDDGKGRHTTSHRELVSLPAGGALVDTPGLRGVALWLTEDGLQRAFDDIEQLATQCRFGDCLHVSEPDCAVLAAVDSGELDEQRLSRWRKLEREAQWIARRSDARLRIAEQKRWKAINLEMRRSGRARP